MLLPRDAPANGARRSFLKAAGLKGRTLALLGLQHRGGRWPFARARSGCTSPSAVATWPAAPWTCRRSASIFGRISVRLRRRPDTRRDGCDALSIHLALAPETRGVVNAALLARLKPGAFVINTSRAEIRRPGRAGSGCRTRDVRAALDVFRGEPEGGAAAFWIPFVAGADEWTPHIGASTEQAQEAIAAETVRIVRTFKHTGKVPNVGNLATRTPATCRLIVRHRDSPACSRTCSISCAPRPSTSRKPRT